LDSLFVEDCGGTLEKKEFIFTNANSLYAQKFELYGMIFE
jgi:hypothetical protein